MLQKKLQKVKQKTKLNPNDEIHIPEPDVNQFDYQNYVTKPEMRLQLENFSFRVEEEKSNKEYTYFA